MATVDNDIIKITLSNTASGNIITVSPGISALSSVSLSLNDLSNVDTSGITNGQTIVYENGNFVAGDAGAVKTVNNENPDVNGNVDISLNDVSQVSITTPSNNEFLKYSAGQWVNDEIEISYVNGLQTALDDKATISSVPQSLNDLSDVTIAGTPSGNQALLYDAATSSFKALASYTNRFEDEVEISKNAIDTASSIFIERSYSVKSDGDGIFIDPNPDTPTSGNVIVRKIYHKSGFITSSDVIGDYTLIHTFADDTAYSSTVSTFEGFRDGNTYGTAPFTLIQVWEEQAAAPSFTGLLNESYGSGAAAAYSVRRLNGNYTGSAVQLERTSDNSFQDIGFDVNGDLDESAITTFCTGTTCKVRTWYDQSGNANNAVQTDHTKQPTIYTGGAIVKENGRVKAEFDGVDDFMQSTITDTSQAFDIYLIFKYNTTPTNIERIYDSGTGGRITRGSSSSTNEFIFSGTALNWSYRQTIQVQETHVYNGLNSVARVSGTETASGDAGSNSTGTNFVIGARDTTADHYLDGSIQELILFDNSKTTGDRTSVEENQGGYFTQNTPLLDTYSGAAAAYSLRKLRSAYTGAAIEVYNGTSYQNIGFNVFGELDTVSLAAFCGGNNGFVSKWYDQSGNANDATQTTAANQPKIYDSVTGVVTKNNKPAASFDNTDFMPSAYNFGSNFSAYAVASSEDLSNNTNLVFSEYGTAPNTLLAYVPRTTTGLTVALGYVGTFAIGTGTPDTNQHAFVYRKNGTTISVRFDATAAANATTSATFVNSTFALSGTNNTLGGSGAKTISEVVIYDDGATNDSGIEGNINTFYNIY